MPTVKYPNITVKLIGEDGNGFMIIGRVRRCLRANKVSEEEVKSFVDSAMSGDYNNLLRTCMEWVNVT